jgi:uncharacterized membrane protein
MEVIMNKKKEMITGAVVSGIMCFIFSFAIGGFIIPFPVNTIANAFGNGMSGLISGVITAIITTVSLFKKIAGGQNTTLKKE